MGVLKLILWF